MPTIVELIDYIIGLKGELMKSQQTIQQLQQALQEANQKEDKPKK